jgi:hypothetical protein
VTRALVPEKETMTGFIEIAADYILSILSKKMNIELTQGRRKTARILMSVFLLIVLIMAVYAVYSMAQIILGK